MLELITLGDTMANKVDAVLIPSQGDDRPYIGVSNDPETVEPPSPHSHKVLRLLL